MDPALRTYADQTLWLLRQFEQMLRETPRDRLVIEPPVGLEANCLLAIAKHATAVTRAYALGLGAGLDVSRDRSTEFRAGPGEFDVVHSQLAEVTGGLEAAFSGIDLATFDTRFLPPPALFGLGEPRAMTPRDAIVENIRHLGIHLGEARLTRSLLAS